MRRMVQLPNPVKQPPFPRSSAVVDPRVGDYGPALLALEDGRIFPGIAFGAQGTGQGDLVVNTSQTGYQEIATDPSYAGQRAGSLEVGQPRLGDDGPKAAVGPQVAGEGPRVHAGDGRDAGL
ncbi:MAG: carbamoyl-phosphate synthase domain-containing protein, partial [Candidatus Limnocylindrales bacterium]